MVLLAMIKRRSSASRLRVLPTGRGCVKDMALNVAALVVLCLPVFASATPLFDESSLATRTLLSVAAFDGRVMAPVVGGRLLFRVRKVYKGWHGDVDRMVSLKNSDVSRLIWIRCRPAADFGQLPSLRRSDGCRLSSVVVGQRYLVFAESFHAVVVNVAGMDRRPRTSTSVGVYHTSGPLVPVTLRSRRIAVQYSDLSFGQYPFADVVTCILLCEYDK